MLLDWFTDHGGKIHPNLTTVTGNNKHLFFIANKSIEEGEKLLEIPFELLVSLDISDFAEINFTEKHDELLSDMTPYRIQTLVFLYELLKDQCSIQYEKAPIVRKKKKKKRQRQAVVQPTGPVKGSKSKWFDYLEYVTKRKQLNTPAYWNEESRKELDNTSLEERLLNLDDQMHEELEKLFLPFFNETALHIEDSSIITFDLFKKIYSFCLSYSWVDESNEIFLAPLSELFIYTPNEEMSNVIIDFGEEFITIFAKKNIENKTKLYHYIGDIGTAEYVWKFGEIDHLGKPNSKKKGVPCDMVQIEPELVFELCVQKADSDDDDLNVSKLELLQEIGLFLDLFEIEKSGEIPTDLLLCVKVMFMDAEEFLIYKTGMIDAGYVIDSDKEDDIDSDDDNVQTSNQDNTTNVKESKKEEKETSEEQENDETVQLLPQIANEQSVFEALIEIADLKIKICGETDTSGISWERSGIIKKPSLISTYLKEVEKDILNKFIKKNKFELKKLEEPKDTSPKVVGKKRKRTKTQEPNSKKAKLIK